MSFNSSIARGTILIFSQTFPPDPASVGQHVADVAAELSLRGNRVKVFASARGFENPRLRYPKRETLGGFEVRRLGAASFGKKTILHRVLGTVAFQVQCLLIGTFHPNVSGIFFSTSPPMIGLCAVVIRLIRRIPVVYWAMDLNPDQVIALGKVSRGSLAARVLEVSNRLILQHAALIIALDRFMAARLLERDAELKRKIIIIPPWPHEDTLIAPRAKSDAPNPFAIQHGLEGKFVVMYSGNHSPSNPLTTLLQAAVCLKDVPNLLFLFVGGGSGKREVEQTIAEHSLGNVRSLPYEPLHNLRHSLAAASVHVVALGESMVGVIHPCKIYNAMAAGKPILYFGPRPSHITDILDGHEIGMCICHGDIDGAVAAIDCLRALSAEARNRMGDVSRSLLRQTFGQAELCGLFCDQVEKAMNPAKLARHDSAGKIT